MRLIDADLLEPDTDYDDGEYRAYSKAQIDNALTVNWYKTSRWVGVDDSPYTVYKCCNCETIYDTVGNTWDIPRYCPNCGASMSHD